MEQKTKTDVRMLLTKVQERQAEVNKARSMLQDAEMELTRCLVETKQWDLLRPVYSQINFMLKY
jgi:hypothetical protein